MSTKLLDLRDKIVTDKGEVITKYDKLLSMAMNGEDFTNLTTIYNDDVALYNLRSGGKRGGAIATWEDDGELTGPDEQTYQWNIPRGYANIDIEELCSERLEDLNLLSDEYVERLVEELAEMSRRDMYPFIRCLLYITQTIRDRGGVWGVGRGSSCASLVMFLLGINQIDPVKYDIPLNEFLK